MAYCNSCGNELRQNANFCSTCGATVGRSPVGAIDSETGERIEHVADQENLTLEPRDFGQIVSETAKIYRNFWIKLLAIVAVAEVALWVVGFGFERAVLSPIIGEVEIILRNIQNPQSLDPALLEDFLDILKRHLPILIIGGVLFLVLSFIVSILSWGALVYAVSHSYVNHTIPPRLLTPMVSTSCSRYTSPWSKSPTWCSNITLPARKVASPLECGFCNLTKADCPERAAGDTMQEGETSDF